MRSPAPLLVAGILVVIVLSGCISGSASNKEALSKKKVAGVAPPAYAAEMGGKYFAHAADATKLDPSSLLPVLPSASYVSVGKRGAEPSIGVTKNGMIFFQALSGSDPQGAAPATMRSDDGGRTWKDIAKAPFTAPTTLDPFLWVDPTTDRVFVDHLYVACSYLSMSDDYGETWVTNPIACGAPGNDHQKVATGPFRGTLQATPLYKNVVYYGYNNMASSPATGASRVSISLDGGLTFPINTESVPEGTCSGGLHGRLHAGPDGYVYVPKRDCDGVVVAASADNGLTWTQVKVGKDVGSAQFRKNPEIAIDSENNVYLVWAGKDNRLYLSTSHDHGKTWTPSMLATPPDVTTATMPSVVAGSAGRIAFAYYGVAFGNGKSPECVGNDETWDVYITWSLNALEAKPSFLTERVNALDDPVQIGGISTNSGAPPPECKYRRNLLDFIDMVADKDGRVYVATADGCIACADQAGSSGSMGMASVEATGPSLLAGHADFTDLPKGVTS